MRAPDPGLAVPAPYPQGKILGGFARSIHRHKCARCGEMTEEGKWRRRKSASGRSEVVCLDCAVELKKLADAMNEAASDPGPKRKSKKPACPKGRERKWSHHLVQGKPGMPFVCTDCGFEWVDPETAAGVVMPDRRDFPDALAA